MWSWSMWKPMCWPVRHWRKPARGRPCRLFPWAYGDQPALVAEKWSTGRAPPASVSQAAGKGTKYLPRLPSGYPGRCLDPFYDLSAGCGPCPRHEPSKCSIPSSTAHEIGHRNGAIRHMPAISTCPSGWPRLFRPAASTIFPCAAPRDRLVFMEGAGMVGGDILA